jgi:hypothetical protein
MEEKPVIRRFSLLNSRKPFDHEIHSKIQQLLYYAESRFWRILIKFMAADYKKNDWCQKLLHRELVRGKVAYNLKSTPEFTI